MFYHRIHQKFSMASSGKICCLGVFLAALLWTRADGARPEREISEETRLSAPSPPTQARVAVVKKDAAHAADVVVPSKTVPSFGDAVFNFPKTVGLYHMGMQPRKKALEGAIGGMSDAVLDLDQAVSASHDGLHVWHSQVKKYDEQLKSLDSQLEGLDVVKKQFSEMEPQRTESMDHIPWTEYSLDGQDHRAIDWHKERWTDGVDGGRGPEHQGADAEHADADHADGDHADSLLQKQSRGLQATAPEAGTLPEAGLSPAARIALGTDSLPGENGDWSHLDKEELIKAAGELVPPELREKAEELWKKLPDGQLREWMPKYFKNIRAEADMKKYKASLEASDTMDDTGQSISENAAKTMKSLVKTHKSMEDWHTTVNANIRDLDKMQVGLDTFKDEVVDHLKMANQLRLTDFNAQVGPERLAMFEVQKVQPQAASPVTSSSSAASGAHPFGEDAEGDSEDGSASLDSQEHSDEHDALDHDQGDRGEHEFM